MLGSVPIPVKRGERGPVMMTWHHHGGWVAGDWWVMGPILVFFWGVVIAFLVSMFRTGRQDQWNSNALGQSQEPAVDVSAKGSTRGEVNDQEVIHGGEVPTATSRAPDCDVGHG
jgi:uncharacterized membrane protein